jgi:histone H3/H4
MASSKIFALTAMEKIFKKAGAQRVSSGAQQALKDVLEEKGRQIALKAKKFAVHAGRKTVKSSDIKLAGKE